MLVVRDQGLLLGVAGVRAQGPGALQLRARRHDDLERRRVAPLRGLHDELAQPILVRCSLPVDDLGVGWVMSNDSSDQSGGGGDPVDEVVAGVSAGQAAADDEDLRAAVTELTRLTTGGSLEESLVRIASLAVAAVPGAEGAGVTMLEPGRRQTVVVSAPFVRQVDDIQYGLGEGPCITAAHEARTVISGSLGADRSWPRFGPRVEALGVHSALSLPLMIGSEVLGALNIYAHPRDVFDAHAAALGEAFAVPAAVAVHNVGVFSRAQRLATQLQAALSSRAVVDQAIGILISRQGSTAEEAFDALRVMSQRDHVKLSVLAASVVAEATRRARARRTQN